MKTKPAILILSLFTILSCTQKIERSGIVVDRATNEPLMGVSIDLYLKYQTGDSLKQKVVTNQAGYFYISEKIGKKRLFELRKEGYIGHTSSISVKNDTIKIERLKTDPN